MEIATFPRCPMVPPGRLRPRRRRKGGPGRRSRGGEGRGAGGAGGGDGAGHGGSALQWKDGDL